MQLLFRAVDEPVAGPKWEALFKQAWPTYRQWFLSEGDQARPSYGKALKALKEHMPEMVPTYERLVELAGGGDVVARFLSVYCPPPYISGCSQVVWNEDEPALVRNYDYSPRLCDAVILHTKWNKRGVIAMSDCIWGVLDGMNDAGLAVSLAFGGKRDVGVGFGIPLVLRYILEFCTTAAEAAAILKRVPVHMAYNVTAVDLSGYYFTAYVSPGLPAVIRKWPLATNHQEKVDWPAHAVATASVERAHFLASVMSDPGQTLGDLHTWFLRPPLYSSLATSPASATLYTAEYRPRQSQAMFYWPTMNWAQSFGAFEEGERLVDYG